MNAPELIAPIMISDGTVQRSVVRDVSIDFDSEISVMSGAFTVYRRDLNANNEVVLTPVPTAYELIPQAGGKMRVRLTFSGADFVMVGINGGLKIGNYQLDIDGSKILSVVGNQMFDGDQDGVAGGHKPLGNQEADKFYAMFGDINGTRAVGASENNAFRRSYSGFGAFDPRFDADGNGALGAVDLNEMRRSLARQRLTWR